MPVNLSNFTPVCSQAIQTCSERFPLDITYKLVIGALVIGYILGISPMIIKKWRTWGND